MNTVFLFKEALAVINATKECGLYKDDFLGTEADRVLKQASEIGLDVKSKIELEDEPIFSKEAP